MNKKPFPLRKFLIISTITGASFCVVLLLSYFAAGYYFNRYFEKWGQRLVTLEQRGLLSTEYGAAWRDILTDEAMEREAGRITADSGTRAPDSIRIVDGIHVNDYPSLSIIRRLNEIHEYSNTINIVDRKNRPIALIRTNHTRGILVEFPATMIAALLAAEDKHFYDNKLGFEFDSYVRAVLRALWHSITTLHPASPKGTSTITQQVAKLFISDVDSEGRRIVGRTFQRKVREMRIAAALRAMYKPEEILEVYLNHCVTSDYGLIGFKDISRGLLRKDPQQLNDAECIYLARMVKWGRNVHPKIARQCQIDMSRMAEALGWDLVKQRRVLDQIDSLTFVKPRQIQTDYGHLVDLANQFWLKTLQKGGASVEDGSMDLIDPNSLIRKKGNLMIRLTIDLALQRQLERLVKERGYGGDTIITTDVRIGGKGEDVDMQRPPRDTMRSIIVLQSPQDFTEENSQFVTKLNAGDTLVTNIRYRRLAGSRWHRSCYYYARRKTGVEGQYFSYCMLDSRTGKLLAYYSRDKIGSRLAGLIQNRVPNGSSTAKPVFNALNFDLGIFKPYDAFCDSAPVNADVPWKRMVVKKENGGEAIFAQSAVKGKGYRIHNHGYVLEGCQYVFDHLATSNNIQGVETVYRLNQGLFDAMGNVKKEAFALNQFFYRIGAFGRIKSELKLQSVTGVRVYKELARIVGVDTDSMTSYGKRVPVSDSLYSVGLGTLELSLLEQAHIYNMLYNNDLIERPAEHPSLFIDTVILNGKGVDVAVLDTVRRFHPFSDLNNLRPTYLGMHKRLVGNLADGLVEYDMPCSVDSTMIAGGEFNPDAFLIDEPLSNYAKSGTTDDVMRPFNADVASPKRASYGLWNAVIRIDFSALSSEVVPDVRDVTIACIGECNTHYTGVADGKTLHKFLTRGLLKLAGAPVADGFFTKYEHYLRRVTPDTVFARCCGETAEREKGGFLRGIISLFKKKDSTATASSSPPAEKLPEAIEEGDVE
jgi:hypothetical protein